MGMTMTEKILAAHSGREKVTKGEFIYAALDMVLGNDITTPVAIKEFNKTGVSSVFDRDKISLVPDHFTPNKDIKSAEQCMAVRKFAAEMGITNYFEIGEMGIEHALLPEKGLVVAGDAVIGADSHTCTYGALNAFSTGIGSTDMAAAMATGKCWFKVPSAIRFNLKGRFNERVSGKDLILYIIGMIGVSGARYMSMEFGGEGMSNLTMDDRFTVANMAIEAGAKNGIFEADEITLQYIKEHSSRKPLTYKADDDAEYERVYEIDLDQIPYIVACPHSPDNIRNARELKDITIDQVLIGSCTNGRLNDLKAAAEILQGRKIHKGIRAIIIPATQKIYLDALKLGYIETFIKAGCVVSTPTCGPCLGGHMGILGAGERAISTTNRNFVGRMGHTTSEVYLASPAVAAASALSGRISVPDKELI